MKVSVVMPVFNGAPTLAEALESLARQTLQDFELLLFDDASTDRTPEIAADWAAKDSRVHVLRSPVNRGPAYGRNRAIEVARGTWIALLDADDLFLPPRLERLVAAAESLEADFLADNQLLRLKNGRHCLAYREDALPVGHPLTVKTVLARDIPDGRSRPLGFLKPLIRRDFLREKGLSFPEELRAAEDLLLFVAALRQGARFLAVPEALYVVGTGEGSLTRSRDQSGLMRELLAGHRALEELLRSESDDEVARLLSLRERVLLNGLAYWTLRNALQRREALRAAQAGLDFFASPLALKRLYHAAVRRLSPGPS